MTGSSGSRASLAAAASATRGDLAQLVRWMLESGMYDTEDVVEAIARTEKYADELYAATHEFDQSSFDELIEIREKAGDPAQMPGGWTAVAVSQLDTQVRCGHGAVVLDTRADRVTDVEEAVCDSGCAATARYLFRSEALPIANVLSLPRR